MEPGLPRWASAGCATLVDGNDRPDVGCVATAAIAAKTRAVSAIPVTPQIRCEDGSAQLKIKLKTLAKTTKAIGKATAWRIFDP
jgi:hypothetical protein